MSQDRALVDGAVLLLIDATGAVRARALSNANGTYELRVPSPGRFRISARRIGFRLVDSDVIALTSDTTIVVEMTDVPRPLPAVTTVEHAQCHVRPDSVLTVSALWEDAKTALYAAAITRDDPGYLFDIVDHRRQYDYKSLELRDVALAEGTVRNTRSWASVTPERLRRDGYVLADKDSTTFVAPDIEILISPYFADTHCLRMHGKTAAAGGRVGIDFDPAEKFGHVEVRGTLWLDEKTRELSSLDFFYVDFGPPTWADTLAGGHVELTRLATGARVMTDWSIRMPIGHLAGERTRGATPRVAAGRLPPRILAASALSHNDWVIDEIRVVGGTLRRVLRDTSVIWSRAVGAIDVRAEAPEDSIIADATVHLVGSRNVMRTDTAGTARIDRLVPGAYLVDVGTDELDALGRPRTRARVDVDTLGHTRTKVKIESAMDAARSTCGADAHSLPDDAGVIVGAVTRRDQPVAGRLITVSWATGPLGTNPPGPTTSRTATTLAGDGAFLFCGVPRDRPLTVHVDGDTTFTVTSARARVVRVLPLSLP